MTAYIILILFIAGLFIVVNRVVTPEEWQSIFKEEQE